MGQNQSAPPPPPPRCSVANEEASKWQKNLNDTQRIYEEKRLEADNCSPELAQARALMGSRPTDCQVNDVQLNMARNDVTTRDKKWEQCYPEEAVQRRLRTLRNETNTYIDAKRTEQREANAAFQTKLNAVQKMTILSNELKTNLGKKLDELKALTSNRENLEQYERRERRAFLDNSPQSGVSGVPGVRTGDDRALLTFWITYGAAIIMASLFVLNIYGDKLGAADMKSKAQIISALLLVAYFIAYYLISYYG
jgi:hypothetical protein